MSEFFFDVTTFFTDTIDLVQTGNAISEIKNTLIDVLPFSGWIWLIFAIALICGIVKVIINIL